MQRTYTHLLESGCCCSKDMRCFSCKYFKCIEARLNDKLDTHTPEYFSNDDNKGLRCCTCGQHGNLAFFSEHTHKNDHYKQRSCFKCGLIFFSARMLKSHLKNQSCKSRKDNRCGRCWQNFNTQELLREHTGTTICKLTCCQCLKLFDYRHAQQKHIKTCRMNNINIYEECAYCLLPRHDFVGGKQCHVVCPLCEMLFSHNQSRNRHLLSHITRKEFKPVRKMSLICNESDCETVFLASNEQDIINHFLTNHNHQIILGDFEQNLSQADNHEASHSKSMNIDNEDSADDIPATDQGIPVSMSDRNNEDFNANGRKAEYMDTDNFNGIYKVISILLHYTMCCIVFSISIQVIMTAAAVAVLVTVLTKKNIIIKQQYIMIISLTWVWLY